MTAFLISYFAVAILIVAAVFVLSMQSEKHPAFKTVLLVLYVLTLVGIIFVTGCLESKYGFSRLKSSAIAVLILLMIYLADNFGSKKAKENTES